MFTARCQLQPHLTLTAAILLLAVLPAGCHHRSRAVPIPPDPLDVVPSKWIDLAESPFVAAIRNGKAVLINRTQRSWDSVAVGCVVRKDAAVLVVGELFGATVHDSLYRPGGVVGGLLQMVNNIDYYVANEQRLIGRTGLIRPCRDDERIALTSAALGVEYRWSADGTRWEQSTH